jgi:hypothetical protein
MNGYCQGFESREEEVRRETGKEGTGVERKGREGKKERLVECK